MVSSIIRELATAASSNTARKSYNVSDYSKRPLAPSIGERESAGATFRNMAKQSKSIRPLSIHQYIWYRLRFVMAAALCDPLGRFVGVASRFSNISIALQISFVENPNISMLYGEELQNRLSKYAGEWSPSSD